MRVLSQVYDVGGRRGAFLPRWYSSSQSPPRGCSAGRSATPAARPLSPAGATPQRRTTGGAPAPARPGPGARLEKAEPEQVQRRPGEQTTRIPRRRSPPWPSIPGPREKDTSDRSPRWARRTSCMTISVSWTSSTSQISRAAPEPSPIGSPPLARGPALRHACTSVYGVLGVLSFSKRSCKLSASMVRPWDR